MVVGACPLPARKSGVYRGLQDPAARLVLPTVLRDRIKGSSFMMAHFANAIGEPTTCQTYEAREM